MDELNQKNDQSGHSRKTLLKMIPEDAELVLESGQKLTLKAAQVEDFIWMESLFGAGGSKRFMGAQQRIPLIVYRLLSVDSKKLFPRRKETQFTDEGDEIEVHLTSPQVLAQAMAGLPDIIRATEAMNKALGVSDKIADALEQAVEIAPDAEATGKKAEASTSGISST